MPTNKNVTVTSINIATQKATVEAEYKGLIAGIDADTVLQTVTLNGVDYTKAQLRAKFQSRLDAAENTKTARTALHAVVAAERQIQVDVGPLRQAFKGYLQSRFGKSSPELQKYGFTPAKKPQRPVATKAEGIARNKATRTARHTMGKKQRLDITGDSPSTQPTAPAPAATPAPAGKANGIPNPGTAS